MHFCYKEILLFFAFLIPLLILYEWRFWRHEQQACHKYEEEARRDEEIFKEIKNV